MTKRSLSFHLLVLIPLLAGCRASAADSGATCAGPVDVQTVEDVRALSACTTIDGDLRILSTSLTDLSGLERLVSVRNLVVADNAALVDLAGLDGLRHADGIAIYNNPKLTSLRALGAVQVLEGVWVENNPALAGLDGLQNLEDAPEVTILSNAVVASVSP